MMLYLLSFITLFAAELSGNLHSLATTQNRKYKVAISGAFSSALWCIKIMIIVNQPLTIITAFLGAYCGSICAWQINEKLNKKYP